MASTNGLIPTATLSSLYVLGAKIKSDIRNAITSADISMSTSQVTQLTITLIDQDFKILKTGLFNIGIPVRYKDLDFVVSNVETSAISGNEGITIKCRPETVQKLKNRKGTKVMKHVSPSEFVISECKAVGAKYHVQPSAKRSSVARDKPKAKEHYDADEKPSTWTTFNRLASELGFALFEMAGVIYFGKPTYFLSSSKKSPLPVTWNIGGTEKLSESVPACVRSVDSAVTTIQVTLPIQRAAECRVGRAMKLAGVPTFDGYYLIDSVDYSISGNTSRIQLTASTPINPTANPPAKKSKSTTTTSSSGGTIYKTTYGTSKGSWPISRRYHVGTPFGRRGSWAAGYHTGTDFPAPRGVPVYAVYSGTISIGGWGSEYGNHVLLHVGSRRYGYCHLSKIKVHSGQSVRSGQILGYVGDTGRAFGTHLHLELRVSPYRYGRDSRNPIPTLGKTIKVKHTIAVKTKPKYSAGTSNTKRATDFVSHALSRTGSRYVFGAARNPSNKSQRTFDCSSLVQWALYQTGIHGFPGTTFSQEPYLRRKGALISIAAAYRTRGALLYRSVGGDHVAISLGNGRTIEAANRSTGVKSLNARGRVWNHAYRVPGLRYG